MLETASYNRQEVVTLAKQDLDFFASLLMPDTYSLEFPDLHRELWRVLCEKVVSIDTASTPQEKFPQIAIGWPRGHAKTTIVKLLADWIIQFTGRHFILLVNSNLTKAQNSLSDVCDMLNEDNVQTLFGDWKTTLEVDRADLKKFSYNGRDRILAALGSGGDPRGLNLKNERPDVIIMDDIQSKENSDSPIQSKALLQWMTSTLSKAKSPHGCIFIYIGNMFSSPGCILKILRSNPNWMSIITGGILANGSSLWPALRSKEELLQELKEDMAMGTPEAFFSEIMNDENSGVTSCFDITKIPAVPFSSEDIIVGSFVIIDIAGDKINSDDTSIMHYSVYEGMKPVCDEIKTGIFSPGDTIKHALQICLSRGTFLIAIESVAYQVSILYWFDVICRQMGIEGIQLVELFPKRRSKNTRILTMFKTLVPSGPATGQHDR